MSFVNFKADKIVVLFILLAFFLFCYLVLDIDKIIPVWESFPDYIDYVGQSKFSLFSYKFYFPTQADGINGRPFTVPLMYKLVGSIEPKVVIMQKVFHCITSLAFVLAILQFIKNHLLKVLISLSLFFYFTWWNILGWSDMLLSESLSMSFMILWFAGIAFFVLKKSWFSLFLMLITGFLFSFTRDSWPYIVLFTYSIIGGYYFFAKKPLRLKTAIMWVFGLATFLFQHQTSNVGLRHTLPVFNAIAERVVENDEYLDWFITSGMPQAEQLKADFRGQNVDSREDNHKLIYARYADGTYTQLFKWIKEHGKRTYSKFVLCHPSYFFLMDQSEKEKERILCHSLRTYNLPASGFFTNAANIFPLFNVWIIIVMSVTLLSLFIKHKGDDKLIYPFLLLALCIVNVLLSYNADSLEVERHLFVTQIILQLIGIICSFMLFDLLAEKLGRGKHV